jgi:integrase
MTSSGLFGELAGNRFRNEDVHASEEPFKKRPRACVRARQQCHRNPESLPANGRERLRFTNYGRTPLRDFTSIKKRLDAQMPDGTEPWVLHDLRRTFASGCAKLGIAIHVVEKCLGHASGTFRGIVSVYQRHDFAAEQRAAVETWSRHVAQIVSGETANVFPMLRAAT